MGGGACSALIRCRRRWHAETVVHYRNPGPIVFDAVIERTSAHCLRTAASIGLVCAKTSRSPWARPTVTTSPFG